jgi:hypothetical protein
MENNMCFIAGTPLVEFHPARSMRDIDPSVCAPHHISQKLDRKRVHFIYRNFTLKTGIEPSRMG